MTGRPAALGPQPSGITKPASTIAAATTARPKTAPSQSSYFAQFLGATNLPINIPGAKAYMRAAKQAAAPRAPKTLGATAASRDAAAYITARGKQEKEMEEAEQEAAAYNAVFAPGSVDVMGYAGLSESEIEAAKRLKKEGEKATRKVYQKTAPRGLVAAKTFGNIKKNAEEAGKSVPVPVRGIRKTDAELLKEELERKKEMEEISAIMSSRTVYTVWGV